MRRVPRASVPGTCTARGRIVRSQACAEELLNSSGSIDDPAPYHAVPDSFRRSVAVGLHHPVDRDSVGTFELYLFEI